MKIMLQRVYTRFLGKQLDFRVRLFNILAIAGTAISITSTTGCIVNGEGPLSALVNLSTGLFAFGLMEYAHRTGRYRRCYLLTIVVIFFIGFSAIFFVGGGYEGGMPSFFVFAMVFTVFMLEGWRAVVTFLSEFLLYGGLCLYAFYRPESVTKLSSEWAVVTDNITGFLFAGASLSITMFFHFRLYNQQQRELESAREEAMKLSETKSNFLANMSHEIRTPINVILGMNEMVLRESDSERITGYGLNIQNAGKTLLTIINNILDITKIESGKLEMVEEGYRLEDLVGELSVIGQERSAKKGLQFSVETDDVLPTALYGGYIHIKQVAMNFLSNAVKYTRDGSVTLRLRAVNQSADRIMLELSVEDTGIGIKPEHQTTLFEAFTRINLSAHRDVEGTGLGLAIAKELATLMHGRVGLQSKWGTGSIFTLEVPQKIIDSTPWLGKRTRALDWESISTSRFVAPKGMLLVVDDNRENLQVIKFLLGRTQLQVDTAASGGACLEMARKRSYHVILMDYMMPDMDGIETLRRLREEQPELRCPVIALTANAVAGVDRVFLDAGFAAYLTKPVMGKELEEAVCAHLPAKLVTVRKSYTADGRTSPGVKAELATLLAAHGVSLEGGLRYLSGDLYQYKRMTEFFVENYAENRQQNERLAAEEDWESLCFLVHSQKSKSLAVGATGLHQIAANLEQRCRDRDREYIHCAWPLFLLEWSRVYTGLLAFIRRMEELEPTPLPVTRGEGFADRLLIAVRTFRRREAEIELERMLLSANGHERANLLEIRSAIEALDFERAENLLTSCSRDSIPV